PPATPALCPLPLHDALPISRILGAVSPLPTHWWHLQVGERPPQPLHRAEAEMLQPKPAEQHLQRKQHDGKHQLPGPVHLSVPPQDRKSTRLNFSHVKISYAV